MENEIRLNFGRATGVKSVDALRQANGDLTLTMTIAQGEYVASSAGDTTEDSSTSTTALSYSDERRRILSEAKTELVYNYQASEIENGYLDRRYATFLSDIRALDERLRY